MDYRNYWSSSGWAYKYKKMEIRIKDPKFRKDSREVEARGNIIY